MAQAWALGNRASSIIADSMTLRGHCRTEGIPCLVSDADRRRVAEFTRGLKAMETRTVKRPCVVTATEMIKLAASVRRDDPADMQLMTIVSLCFEAMLRAGTPCGTTILASHAIDEGDGIFRIDLHKTKTQRLVAGAVPCWLYPSGAAQHTSVPNGDLLDAAWMMGTYLATSGVKNNPASPLFPKLGPDGKPALPLKALSYGSFLSKFKIMCTRAGVPARSLQALRAGGRTGLAAQGVSEEMINLAGRWVPGSVASRVYNRPGVRLATVVKAAHLRELALAARIYGQI